MGTTIVKKLDLHAQLRRFSLHTNCVICGLNSIPVSPCTCSLLFSRHKNKVNIYHAASCFFCSAVAVVELDNRATTSCTNKPKHRSCSSSVSQSKYQIKQIPSTKCVCILLCTVSSGYPALFTYHG